MRRGLLSIRVVLAATALVAVPAYADEVEAPLPPPAARYGVIGTGVLVTAGSYGLAYGTSYLWPHSPAAESLRIPVVGPWMAIPESGCGRGEQGCDTFPVVIRSVFATLSALGQLGGLGLLAEGLLMNTASESAATAKAPPLYAAPVAVPAGGGVLIGGTF